MNPQINIVAELEIKACPRQPENVMDKWILSIKRLSDGQVC